MESIVNIDYIQYLFNETSEVLVANRMVLYGDRTIELHGYAVFTVLLASSVLGVNSLLCVFYGCCKCFTSVCTRKKAGKQSEETQCALDIDIKDLEEEDEEDDTLDGGRVSQTFLGSKVEAV